MGSGLFASLNLQLVLGTLFLSIAFLCYILFSVCAWGVLFGFCLTPVLCVTQHCCVFCSAAAYSIPQNLLVLSPKRLTLNLGLWSPCQPPPSFACWGLPLAMPSYGGDHVYLEIACTLASNCHINCFVITAWSQAGFCRQIPLLTPTGLAALALCGCPLSCCGAHLLPSASGDGAFFPLCLDRICPFYFASWSL